MSHLYPLGFTFSEKKNKLHLKKKQHQNDITYSKEICIIMKLLP